MGRSMAKIQLADDLLGEGSEAETGYTFGAPVELVVSGVAESSLVEELVRASDAEVKPLPRHFAVVINGDRGFFTLRYSGTDLTREALRELVGRVIPEAVIN